MGVVTKRSSMIFFSDPLSHYSHRVRIVLAEKGVSVEITEVEDKNNIPEDLTSLNPYNELPTLVDRELVLYQSNVMMEYLDERFPHPPLLPVYPVARAESRLYIHRIERDWCDFVNILLSDKASLEEKEVARKELRDSLVAISPVFVEKPYFMSEEFSLVDCVLGPVLWRLPSMGIELPPKQCKALIEYGERVFARESFKASLSEAEREIRFPIKL